MAKVVLERNIYALAAIYLLLNLNFSDGQSLSRTDKAIFILKNLKFICANMLTC